MAKLRIDLRHDSEIPVGRELFEHIVGAHMVAHSEEELLLLVHHSLDGIQTATQEESLKVMMHAVYHAQALLVDLLDVAARQEIELEDCRYTATQQHLASHEDRFREHYLDLWTRLRDRHV